MLKLENVRLRFDSRGIAGLSGISLDIREGEVISILGPNGSGKTTLLRAMTGEIVPEDGLITGNEHVVMMRSHEIDPELNVQKYLLSRINFKTEDEKKIQLTRDLADIFEFTFQLRQKFGELSLGQRQKVLLASELIRNPKAVLLDEPFNHLDPQTRKDILQSLFSYVRRQNITIVWVTHDLNEALRFSNRLVLLQHGKVEQEGAPEELVKSPRNIFVASFMGYHNFFPVRRSGHEWETPWGKISIPGPIKDHEAILVIPDSSWKLGVPDSPEMIVEEQYLKDTLWTLKGDLQGRKVQIQTQLRPSNSGKSLKIIPLFEETFLIPL